MVGPGLGCPPSVPVSQAQARPGSCGSGLWTPRQGRGFAPPPPRQLSRGRPGTSASVRPLNKPSQLPREPSPSWFSFICIRAKERSSSRSRPLLRRRSPASAFSAQAPPPSLRPGLTLPWARPPPPSPRRPQQRPASAPREGRLREGHRGHRGHRHTGLCARTGRAPPRSRG